MNLDRVTALTWACFTLAACVSSPPNDNGVEPVELIDTERDPLSTIRLWDSGSFRLSIDYGEGLWLELEGAWSRGFVRSTYLLDVSDSWWRHERRPGRRAGPDYGAPIPVHVDLDSELRQGGHRQFRVKRLGVAKRG